MDKFNDIEIDDKLDWNRIEKLMRIGIFAACMVLVGDVLIGYGMHDSSKTGMEWFLSAYLQLSDTRMFWSAFLFLYMCNTIFISITFCLTTFHGTIS